MKTLDSFTKELASNAPVPGGGGVSALLAALSASLCSMAANLTCGKEKYADIQDELYSLIETCENLRNESLSLIDGDTECFLPLVKAYSIPKDNPERESILFDASLKACEATCRVMECCCRTVELLEYLYSNGSRMMISDVGCGAVCAESALKTAAMNILINTKNYRSNPEAVSLEADVSDMLKEYGERAHAVSTAVMNSLKD